VGGRAKLESIRDLTRTAEMVQSESGSKAVQVLRIIAPRVIHLTSEHGGEIRRAAEVESGEHGGVMVTLTSLRFLRI
jgi:hypothetical protein